MGGNHGLIPRRALDGAGQTTPWLSRCIFQVNQCPFRGNAVNAAVHPKTALGHRWQPCLLGGEQFVDHRPDLVQRADRRRQRIEHDRVVDVLLLAAQRRLHGQALDVDVRLVDRRALRRQRTEPRRLDPVAVDQAGDFDAAASGQVVDQAIDSARCRRSPSAGRFPSR